MDCNYTFLIDLAPNGILSSAKAIEKVLLQTEFGLIQQNAEQNLSSCVYYSDIHQSTIIYFYYLLIIIIFFFFLSTLIFGGYCSLLRKITSPADFTP